VGFWQRRITPPFCRAPVRFAPRCAASGERARGLIHRIGVGLGRDQPGPGAAALRSPRGGAASIVAASERFNMNSAASFGHAVGRPAVGSTADAASLITAPPSVLFCDAPYTPGRNLAPSVPSPWSPHQTRGLYIDFRQQVTVPWCDLLVGNAAWFITAKLATDGRDRQMRTSDRMGYGSLMPQFGCLRSGHPVACL
jgi:hypothetical protein